MLNLGDNMDHDILKRIVRMSIILIYAITLSAFIATILGGDFFLCGRGFCPAFFIEFVLRFIPFIVQSVLSVGFIFNRDWKFIGIPLVIFILLDLVTRVFLSSEFMAIHTFVFPVLFIFVLMVVSKRYKQTVKNGLIFILLFAPATLMGACVRSQTFTQNQMSLQALMSLAIDVMIISIAIHYVGVGGVEGVKIKNELANKMVLPKRKSNTTLGEQIYSPQTSFVWLIRNLRHWRDDDWWRWYIALGRIISPSLSFLDLFLYREMC